MNEYAGDLIVVIVEVPLLLQDALRRDGDLWKEPPNDHVTHFRAGDHCADVILHACGRGVLLVFRNYLVGVVDGGGDDCASRAVALDLGRDQ